MSYLDLSILEIHKAIIEGKVTPLDLVKESLKRAKEDDNNAFEYICEKEALEEVNKLDPNKKDSLLFGIPFVGSDVLPSAIAQDKITQKEIFECEELPITEYIWFYDSEWNDDKETIIEKIEKKVKYPVIVKPATLGSSVGIKSCNNREELIKAVDGAIEFDTKIVVEEKVENLTEVNISVLGNYENQNLSEIEQVYTDNDLLTYEDKYIGGGKKGGIKSKGMANAQRKIPADISEKMRTEVENVARRAFVACNLSGNVRIDFLINEKNKKVYINEINSCPGSLAFYLWDPKGKDFTKLLDDMISVGIKDYKKRTNKTHSFETNILKGFNGLKGAKGKLK